MRALLLGAALALLAAAPASAAPELVKLGDFTDPLHVTSPPDDPRLFVVEKQGLIKIVGGGTFLDATALTESAAYERGLLSMAFSSGYAANGLFYIFVTERSTGDLRVHEVRRSATDPNRADAASARPILTIEHSSRDNHNGGQLQFGPDGMLYVSTGDGAADSGTAEQTEQRAREDPADRPGHGRRGAGQPVRQPGLVLRPAQPVALLVRPRHRRPGHRRRRLGVVGGDRLGAGPGAGAGLNFGWANCEGPDPTHSCGEHPVVSMDHGGDDTFLAIVGGYVVRDPGLPTLNGRYLYGDNYDTSLWSVVPRTGADNREEAMRVEGLDVVRRGLVRAPLRRLDGLRRRLPHPGRRPVGVRRRRAGAGRRGRPERPRATPWHQAAPAARLLTCDEACRVTVNSRLRRVQRLKARHRSLAANRRALMRVKLSRKTARRMRRTIARRGYVRVVVQVRAVDAAGNARAVTKRGRIKRCS